MPSTLADAASLVSPLPLLTAAEARITGTRVPSIDHHRVRPGVYVRKAAWNPLPPWDRYRVRVHAYLRTHPDAVLCLESAAVIHGLPFFGEPRDIHVYAPYGGSSRRFGDVVIHTSDTPRVVEEVGGIRATSMLDTVVDLARALAPAQALAVADAAASAVRGGTVAVTAMRERDAEQPHRRGRARALWVWDRADGTAESAGESVSRAAIEWCGFELPELQRNFWYERHNDRTDFFFPSVGAVGESDGWGKYHLLEPEKAAQALVDEKRREDRLRRNGHVMARWDLADVQRVKPFRAALAAAGVPRTRAEQPAMLATLMDKRRTVSTVRRAAPA